MSKLCGTSGGKGNIGMFYERSPKVCAAAVPSAQPTNTVGEALQHYLLQEEAEALIRDAIHPPPKPLKLPPLRCPPHLDQRNTGPYNQVREIVNPPTKTKFQTLAEDFKETVYTSYWKKVTGRRTDPVPILPQGLDIYTAMGKKLEGSGRLYDIIMPKDPVPDKTPVSKKPGYQVNRKYCESYDPNKIFGIRNNVDPRGIWAKCSLTYDDIEGGTALKKPVNTKLANFQDATRSRLGVPLAPYNNISCVPEGYAFGKLQPPSKLAECMATCDLNPEKDFFKKCIGHLNTVRKFMSKRFEPTLFRRLSLTLRYYDKEKTGWLPKTLIYDYCTAKFIRFIPSLIEPLLGMLNAFDGAQIKYETLILMLNFTQPTPELPHVRDIPEDCVDFRTTYSEMVKPGQEIDKRRMAGLPSGRYFDIDYPITPIDCCKADRTYLPEETDVKANLNPSIYTLTNVSHRDMYAKREPEVVKRVYKAIGETISDETFEKIWARAKKYHSQGWVCFETFRRSKDEIELEKKGKKD